MKLNDLKKEGIVVKNGKLVSNKSKSPKYRNEKVLVDDYLFDSIKEANFYSKLKLLKKSNNIRDFEKQFKFEIVINDIHVANYFLDFKIIHNDGKVEYIDIKGQDKKTGKFITTDVFQLKKKLVEAIYGITIKII
jgi:hypothetical protein